MWSFHCSLNTSIGWVLLSFDVLNFFSVSSLTVLSCSHLPQKAPSPPRESQHDSWCCLLFSVHLNSGGGLSITNVADSMWWISCKIVIIMACALQGNFANFNSIISYMIWLCNLSTIALLKCISYRTIHYVGHISEKSHAQAPSFPSQLHSMMSTS